MSIHPDLPVPTLPRLLPDEELDVPPLQIGMGHTLLASLAVGSEQLGRRRGVGGVAEAALIEGEDAGGGELGEEGEVVVVPGDVLVEALWEGGKERGGELVCVDRAWPGGRIVPSLRVCLPFEY